MRRFLQIRGNRPNNATNVIGIGSMPLHKAVEQFQRELATYSSATGVTYRLIEANNLADALIESGYNPLPGD